MEIQVRTMKRCEFIAVAGQIDADTAPQLQQRLLDLVAAGKRNLVVSLAQVSFVSSAGARALVAVQIALRRAEGGEMVISEPQPVVRRTLELLGLDRVLLIFEQDAQAVGAF